MKILRIFATIIAGLTVSLALVFLASYFGLIPGVRTYIVLSGSMEPAVRVGSLVMVAPQKTYLENEIISYSPDGSQENVITHRIISKQYPKGVHQPAVYLTAGDANPFFDKNPVKENQVLGKAVLALPYLGIWANFVKQPLGFILFVIVPATIIVWEELRNIQKESKKIYQKIKARQNQETNPLSKEKRGFNQGIIALPIFAAALALTSLSLSVFSDREMSGGNSFVASEWAMPSITPTPTTQPTTDHLVISEVQIRGEVADQDFVELYNPTNSDISLDGWKLRRKTSGGTEYSLVSISGDYTIPAHGFFLWANNGDGYAASIGADVSNTSYLAGNSSVALRMPDNTLVDQLAWGSGTNQYVEGTAYPDNPPANQSIERKAYSSSTSVSMGPGGADSLQGNGYDSDDNSVDFVLRTTSEPQNSSSSIETP